MYGAYGYSVKDEKEVYDRFEVSNTLAGYKPRWNVRLTQMAPVIYMTADGVQIKEMYWSFIEDVENHVLRAWSEFNGFAS
jgi:putative SOS response-associated peptidase YedK